VRNKKGYTGRERAGTDKLGDCYFDSTDFSVADDGKVSLSGTGALESLTSDSGDAAPVVGQIDIAGGAGIDTSGSGNTITIAGETATASNAGIVELATDAEVLTGTDTSRAVTAANISYLKDATDIVFTASPLLQAAANTGAAPVGTDTATNIMICQEGEVLEVTNIGTQTIIAPRMAAAGLLTSLDLTDNEGAEYNWGVLSNSKHQYTIGTDPAFYLEWRFTLADVTGCDPVGIGFRKTEANDAALANYTDFAWIGVSETDNSATISLKTRLNSGAVTTTDTTDAWTDGQTHTLKVLVSGAGVVTYEIDGAAPTATAAFTFDDTDVVMPFFYGLHGTTSPGAWHWVWCKAGVQ
jgi:hypothetical protein